MKTSTPTPKKRQERWLLPDAAGWTLGTLDDSGRGAVPNPGAVRADGVVWPLRGLIGLPLWLAGHDASTFAGAASLQMEKQGLGPRSYHEDSLRVREISRDADRTLVLAVALAKQVKDGDVCVTARSYATPLESLTWPSDRVVLFREREHWAAVITRGTLPVYFSVFSGSELPVQAATDLACMVEGLRRNGVVAALTGVTLWDSAGSAVEQALRTDLGLPVVLAARPSWCPVVGASELIHPAVVRHRAGKDRARLVKQVVAAMGAVLLLVLGIAGGRVLWAAHELSALEKEYQSMRAESEGIRKIAGLWRQLEGTIDPVYFPLEHLRAASALLPPNGVRLTEFQWKDGQLKLSAEASDSIMPSAFLEGLRGLRKVSWEMDPLNVQPNNSTQFVIKGKVAP